MTPTTWYEYVFAILAAPGGFFFGVIILICACILPRYFWDWLNDTSDCKIHTELYRDAMRLKGKTEVFPKPAPIFTVASEKETAFSAIGNLAALMALIMLAVALG